MRLRNTGQATPLGVVQYSLVGLIGASPSCGSRRIIQLGRSVQRPKGIAGPEGETKEAIMEIHVDNRIKGADAGGFKA